MSLNRPVRDWHGQTVWLVGASSGIGLATAHTLHARGARVIVSARNAQALGEFVSQHGADPARGLVAAQALPLDAADPQAVRDAAHTLMAWGPLDRAVYCAAHYAEMRATEFDLAGMLRHQQVNYVGALNMLDAVLPHFLARSAAAAPGTDTGRDAGHISLIASVAGYGGLPKSLAYGPTKAALINLAEVLYTDLQPCHIGVCVINPGFVQTPLTAGNTFTMPALMTPEQAAQEIIAGWERGDFEIHFPKRFTYWMKLLRLLPYSLYFQAVRKFTGL